MSTWELSARPGLDESWRAGLAMAAHDRLHFGPDLVFTYGPLGFLESGGLFYTGTVFLSSLFNAALHVAVVVVVLWRLRQSFRPWIAVVLTLLFAEVIRYVGATDTLVIPVVVLGSAVIEGDARRLQRWIVPIAAICTAFAFLMKANSGISLVAASVLVVWFASPGRFRSELHYGTLTLALFLLGWIVSGNRVGDIPTWLSGVYQISTGYPAAMGTESGPRSDYLLVPVAIVTVAGLVYLSARTHPLADRSRPPCRGHPLRVLPARIRASRLQRSRLLHPLPARGAGARVASGDAQIRRDRFRGAVLLRPRRRPTATSLPAT